MLTTLALLAVLHTTPPTPTEVKRSNALFVQAQQQFRAGKYAAALANFEQANALYPHANAVFNLAKCREALGQTGAALRTYHDYLRLEPDAPDLEAVNTSIAALEKRLRETGVQQVRFSSEPEGASLSVDGKPLGTTPAAVELTSGNHTVELRAPGHEALTRTFAVQLARSADLTLALAPTKRSGDVPRPPPMPPMVEAMPAALSTRSDTQPRPRLWTWVAAGVAGASLGTGIGLGLNAKSVAATLGLPHGAPDAARLLRDAQLSALGANVAYGVATAAALTALVLFFVERS